MLFKEVPPPRIATGALAFSLACAPYRQRDTSLLLATANTAGDSGVAWVSSRYGASVEWKEDQRKKGRREEWRMAARIGWMLVGSGLGSWSEWPSGW